jgi:hypothetical protein
MAANRNRPLDDLSEKKVYFEQKACATFPDMPIRFSLDVQPA